MRRRGGRRKTGVSGATIAARSHSSRTEHARKPCGSRFRQEAGAEATSHVPCEICGLPMGVMGGAAGVAALLATRWCAGPSDWRRGSPLGCDAGASTAGGVTDMYPMSVSCNS